MRPVYDGYVKTRSHSKSWTHAVLLLTLHNPNLDLWHFNPKTIPLVGLDIPGSFPTASSKTGIILSELCCGQTDRQQTNLGPGFERLKAVVVKSWWALQSDLVRTVPHKSIDRLTFLVTHTIIFLRIKPSGRNTLTNRNVGLYVAGGNNK